jgi:cell division transport system permease protein
MVSVGLVLFLLGFFGLMVVHARQLLHYYREHVSLILEFKDTATAEDIDSVTTALAAKSYILPESIRFISQEEAARMMRQEFGEDFLALNLPNPFYNILTFNLKGQYMVPGELKGIRNEWRSHPAVSDLFYQENLMGDIVRNLQKLGYLLSGLGLVLTLIVGLLIHNTIRLALYANRFLIKTMELVGATWGFVSRPYLWRALVHGLASGMLAVAGLAGVLFWANQKLPEIRALQDMRLTGLLFGGIVLFGIFLYLLSSWVVVNKYLRMRMDDLY